MVVELTAVHWIYLFFILAIIAVMVMRRDTTLVCIIGIFVLGWIGTFSLSHAISGVFDSVVYAIQQLLSIILIISIVVAMSRVLTRTGINDIMIKPFTRFIRTPGLAFWLIGLLMMVISWFFWPTPAVALMGAILIPVALRVGLPALGVAVAMNLFGHGIALSGDYIIQGAPKLTADGAGISTASQMTASIPLVLVMGLVTTVVAFLFLRRDMKRGKLSVEQPQMDQSNETDTENDPLKNVLSLKTKQLAAIGIPLLFLADVVAMVTLHLQGDESTAMLGGTVILILVVLSLLVHRKQGPEKITKYLIDGLQFGFKVFGPVIPIAAFFYLGGEAFSDIFGEGILSADSQGIVSDLGVGLAHSVPFNQGVAAATVATVGAITGLDGSGFSGLYLVGSISHLFTAGIGGGTATLSSLGQIAAIWVGGGTLAPWALIPVAAICQVDVFELVRRNLVPVIIGLAVTTVVAMFIL